MYYAGLLTGLCAFLIIGLFHPIVIWGEYFFGAKIWPLFLLLGIAFCAGSLYTPRMPVLSAVLGITGFTSFWSIHEILEQQKRVAKGWFPANPRRKNTPAQASAPPPSR